MTTGALMGYSPTDAFGSTRLPQVDHRFGRVYGWDQLTPGVRWFDSYPNGNEQFSRSGANIGVTGLRGPWTLCYNSQYIAVLLDLSNAGQILYLDPSNFSLIGTFGTAGSGGGDTPTNIEQPNCMVSIVGAGSTAGGDIIVCNSALSTGAINAIDVRGVNTPLGATDENSSVLGALPDGSGTTAYIIGYTKLGGAAQIGLYKVPSATLSLTPIAKVLATALDPTWAHIDTVYGLSIDQTDGNIIFGAATGDAVTNKAYFFKLNATSGAVMWRLSLGSATLNVDAQDSMKQNLITKGVMYYLASQVLWTINTIAGTATSQALSDGELGPLHGSQVSEDVTGSLYWFGSWAEGTTHPAYLGTFCLVEGNHAATNTTWRYFPNGQPNPAPTYAIPVQSRRRAWTFTLDDHVFYVLDLGGEGTFLYDTTTTAWCKWITQGWLGWDVTNGVMWMRDRIVGGDYLQTNIWEMQPAAGQDCDSTLSISHVVTGGLVKRSRVFSSCDAFNLACSVGQLDQNGATVELAYSDDQGKTWTIADETQTLAEGDYSGEIAWRSLGSFAGPGRIFRITDVGGFLRIDGADASIDNFDADIPQDDQQG